MRLFWLILGGVSVALGVIGAFLPLLPTTPFMLLAAYCFARSSPRLHAWLLAHPQFGPMIVNWQRHGAISTRAKKMAIVAMLAAFLLAWAGGAPLWALGLQVGVLVCVAIFLLTRPEPPQ